MLTCIGVYSIDDREEFKLVNDKMRRFIKFVTILFFNTFTACYVTVVAPFFGKEKKLFYNIGFTLDWKNNEIGM